MPQSELAANIREKIAAMPRVSLTHLPTPLEELPRLAAALGVERMWVKRDDCTGLAMGGSKVRLLEFLLGDAVSRGATALIAHGSAQSNFVRLVAAAGCRLGMRVVLLIEGEIPGELRGNLLLDELFGAEIRFLARMTAADYVKVAREVSRDLTSRGERCYILPLGGASPLGAVGYLLGMIELGEQLERLGTQADRVVVPVGTGGTLAGMVVAASHPPFVRTELVGVGVSEGKRVLQRCQALATQTCRLLDLTCEVGGRLNLAVDWVGHGYGIPSKESWEAVELAGREAGLLLDPIYTGKAMAGLRGMLRDGRIPSESRVVFWHTGGTPALFACPRQVDVW